MGEPCKVQAKNKGHRWKKGESGNPKGKPKGAKNKTSQEAAQRVLNTLDKLDAKCAGDWLFHLALEDHKTYAMLLRACLPRDSSVEITQREGNVDQASLLQRLIAAKRAG